MTEDPIFHDLFGHCSVNYSELPLGMIRPVVVIDDSWRTANLSALAQAIYADRAFDRLPILADALEDVGCTNADVLEHCRQPGEHARGCWVVDLLLGKS